MYCSYGGQGLHPPPPHKYGTEYTSPLRVFDNFNSKAKTIATFNICKIKSAKLNVAGFLPILDRSIDRLVCAQVVEPSISCNIVLMINDA